MGGGALGRGRAAVAGRVATRRRPAWGIAVQRRMAIAVSQLAP
jgi:hypothetical protein